ncbi:MAG: lipid-A-disaccharide synthase [Proteobacteria bacterium]|uniref:Lipid-A-disaccharide synthase n=1 Tax=Candidatus Avisuccinivibrio stercorigallinarum TaxID=2840704 RepID=A0A9D9DCR4_9GAMM|nr:lipid-A-disaccharide synthase [Candidatus Avisuccinivibrio stercorigallinarum]
MSSSNFNQHLYAVVVGEASGDTLGAGLMRAIKRHDPQASFIGIGGPKMIAEGFTSAFPMDSLSVMGLMEVVSHLMPILKIRKQLIKILLDARPCVVIGIDAPDFNLTVERKLKEAGIPALHYVSPSVWAWREGRMKNIARSCDEVLALLPFEKEFYDRAGMPCTYVGHTLANSIPLEVDEEDARSRIELYQNCVEHIEPYTTKVMAILPGSRKSELTRMVPIFAKTARMVKEKLKDVVFISVAVNQERALNLKDLWLENAPDLSLTIYVGRSQDVIASSDAVLLTCGTVAFETMLLKRPMAVAYKVSPISAMIARRLLKIDMFSLPNLLAKRRVVGEFIQENCNPQALALEMVKLLKSDNLLMKKEFLNIHKTIRMDSDEIAARAVFARIEKQAQTAGNTVQAEAPAADEAAAMADGAAVQNKEQGLAEPEAAASAAEKPQDQA